MRRSGNRQLFVGNPTENKGEEVVESVDVKGLFRFLGGCVPISIDKQISVVLRCFK
jgi:hypothetical protein